MVIKTFNYIVMLGLIIGFLFAIALIITVVGEFINLLKGHR